MASCCRAFFGASIPFEPIFSFTLISANNLPNVRKLGHMKVYAMVSLRNHKVSVPEKTTVDKVNHTNPQWNENFKFPLLQASIKEDPNCLLEVKLYCQRTFGEKKFVGQVEISMKQLSESSRSHPLMSMPVMVGDLTSTQGTIEFSYSYEGA